MVGLDEMGKFVDYDVVLYPLWHGSYFVADAYGVVVWAAAAVAFVLVGDELYAVVEFSFKVGFVEFLASCVEVDVVGESSFVVAFFDFFRHGYNPFFFFFVAKAGR